MRAGTQISVFAAAIEAWRNGFAALARMKAVAGIGFGFMLVLTAMRMPFDPWGEGNQPGLGDELIAFLLEIAQACVLTPVAIAVHRLVLLGEETRTYLLNPSDRRFLRFFGWTVALHVFTALPLQLLSVARASPADASLPLSVAGLTLALAALVIAIRAVILFPAIAVDAPGAGWAGAMRDSRGHFGRMLLALIATALPAMLGYALIERMLGGSGPDLLRPALRAAGDAALDVLVIASLAALASDLYRAWAVPLPHPGDSPAPREGRAGASDL
jgi:hypothetical protein